MRVLLIDVDSTIPNLAIMKLSAYYKGLGHDVSFKKLGIPYYPYKKVALATVDVSTYDAVFISVIFTNATPHIKITGESNIVWGGSGIDLKKKLLADIEICSPDYSLYPGNEFSYGFITRGCIRNCGFCIVREKEGGIKRVAKIQDIIKHKKVKFMDNNILAYPRHRQVLQELVDKQIRCCFNQGLDIRLVDEINSELLRKMNYIGEYIFAFDDIRYKPVIAEKLELLSWAMPWQLKFFIYVSPKQPLRDVVERIVWLKKHKIKPYVMRDISCWGDGDQDFYTDTASWCNQPHLFKYMSFEEFCLKRHVGYKDRNRTVTSVGKWNQAVKKITPTIFSPPPHK